MSDAATIHPVAGPASTATTQAMHHVEIREHDIQRYEEDGAICLRGLFSPAVIDNLRTATEQILAGKSLDMTHKKDPGKFTSALNVFQKNALFKSFAFESPAWTIAQQLMRSTSVRFFADQLFVKEPRTTTRSPWHQDQTYFPVLGEHVCSIWVAMDPVTRASSGLEYIKGSHRWGRRFHPQAFGDSMAEKVGVMMTSKRSDEKIPDIEAHRGEYEFLSWDMEPGDCLVHHSLAVHGAAGNSSSIIRRRAISTRWFGDEAYFRPVAPLFTRKSVGLEPGARMTSPMFPLVPLTGEPIVPWPSFPGIKI